MLLNLGRRGGLRRAGAIVAGLLLAASTMAGTASATVWYVEFTPLNQTHTVVALGSADYSTHVFNLSLTTHWFKVTAISDPTLSAAFTPTACVPIAAASDKALSVRVATTTPGTYVFHLTVHDYTNNTCTNTNWSTGSATSLDTAQIVVTKIPQAITFDAPPTGATVGASGVSVHATNDSPLPVTYSSTTSSICGVNGSTGALTLVAEGACIIAADASGNALYLDAPQVLQNVTIVRNPQTITFTSTAPVGAVVGGTYTPTATATSLLTVALTIDGASSGICSIDGSGLVSFTAVGTCTIDANQAGNVTWDPAPQKQQAVAVGGSPLLTLVKAATQTTFTKAGDTIDYTYTLTNTGNVVLDGPFTVSDDKINGGAAFACGAAVTLPVGASITCTATYAVTLADLDAGKVVNKATAQGLFERADVISAAQAVTVTQQAVSSVAAATGTPPPTSTGSGSSGNSSTPLLALLICLGFAGLGLLAAQAQRGSIRR